MTPAERTERARIAANTRWSKLSASQRRAAVAPGLRGIEEHFERQVDPEGLLSPKERSRQARNARKAQLASARKKALRKRATRPPRWGGGNDS